MSLFSKVSRFARSPQGKKVISQAQQMAKDPDTKRKISDLRSKFDGGGKARPAAKPAAKPPSKSPH